MGRCVGELEWGGEFAIGADRGVLGWFGRVEGVDDYRVAGRVLVAELGGGRARGRPRLGWMGSVRVALGSGGVAVGAARRCARDREAWGPWCVCDWASLARPSLLSTVFFRTALPCSGGYHMERGGMPLRDAVGMDCEGGAQLLKVGTRLSGVWAGVCVLMTVCVFYLT